MRLVTVRGANRGTAGLLIGDEVLVVETALSILGEADGLPSDVAGLLAEGDGALTRLRELQEQLTGNSDRAERLRWYGGLKKVEEGSLLAPLPRPGLVLSCGANYEDHVAEMGVPVPVKPVAFLKSPHSVIGPDSAIRLPPGNASMVDWEAEFCGVIGRPCHRVTEDAALDYVAGYTMIVDVSARDWVKNFTELPEQAPPGQAASAWEQNLLGKQFPTFCPMGPAVTTKDEIPDPNSLKFSLKVNGVTKQSACTDNLVFSLAALIAYYSQWYIFRPGDIVSTGSPSGVGFGSNPPEFLRPGDVVTTEADGIGTMTNPVAAWNGGIRS